MISMGADAISRLMAINCIASHLDSIFDKKIGFGSNIIDLGENKKVFEFKSKVSNINIAKSNLPESFKNGQKSSNFKVLTLSASYMSAFGRESVVKVLARAPNRMQND
jgi:hypothetical protein